VSSCANAYEALEHLRAGPVHILLCDIKMPEVDGFALIRSLTHQPRIILTTAHPEYALESYDVGVVDYLMKPIAFDRFLKALRRATTLPAEPVVSPPKKTPLEYLFFKVEKTFRKIFIHDIEFIEAYGNYVKVHTATETLLVAGKISILQSKLDAERFVRVHKSYLVALAKIRLVESNQIHIGRTIVPVGESYRAAFFGRL
jgi:DNA-binding LytR/AlgR family response regulator